jgi:protein-S-isoprenylcysteine O-methyltransferase Ste14
VRRSTAAVGSILWFAIAAGLGAVWMPWVITGWKVEYTSPVGRVAQAVGIALIVVGLVPTVGTFVEFARAGGTPVPGALPERLVVNGFNRYVRNPIYLGTLVIIVGEALLLGQLSLLVYAAVVWLIVAAFVRRYEEPTLARRFGADYEAYRRAVPVWRPRLHPWSRGDQDNTR